MDAYWISEAFLSHVLSTSTCRQNRLRAAARDVSNEIGSPIRCDQALDPLIAFGNCQAQFKAKSGYRSTGPKS